MMLKKVGRAILPADPLSSGSSRLERRLAAKIGCPTRAEIPFTTSDELAVSYDNTRDHRSAESLKI